MYQRRQRAARYRLEEATGASGTVGHLIPRIEFEIPDIKSSIKTEDVQDAVRGFTDHGLELEFKESLTKRPYRGDRKVYVLLEEVRALKLLKATYIIIGWISCRARRKIEVNRCYRCLGFCRMAANCQGTDRSRSFWRCSEEGHAAGSYTRKPQCYLCSAREDKPWDDHIPETMRCTAFPEAALKRKPSKGRV